MAKDPRSKLPLTPPVFQVLLALADGEKHGYGIIKEVEMRTDGAVRMSAGTLYGIVHRLRKDRLIAESGSRPDPSLDDERRRYDRLTQFGRLVATAEAQRLEQLVDMARGKKLLPVGELS